jgi:tetratricopeptide (TPR) repeat protein
MGRLLGIGCIVCAFFLCSPQDARANQPGDNSELLTITGNVYFEEGRRPVANVSMELRNAAGELLDTAMTTATGGFEFHGLGRKWYSVSVDLGGYEPASASVDMSLSSTTALEIYLKRNSDESASLKAKSISAHELAIPVKARDLLEAGKRKLYVQKDATGALRDFQKAVAAAPNYYEAYYQIAMVDIALAKRDDAEAAFRKSIEASGDTFGEAEIGLGRLTLDRDRGDFLQAEKIIRRGLELKSDSWAGHYELARALVGENRLAEAQKSAEAARTLAPNVALVYELLAIIHFRQKDYAALLADLDAYIKLDPNSGEGQRAKALRAQVIEAIGDPKVAAADAPKQ